MSEITGIFSQYERDELNRITAKSILEKLMNIRQNINVEFTARRLVWELMQNAKDNASLCNKDGEKVDVIISLKENEFIFSHNKGYFTNAHIRGLIRKYSSSDKDRDSEQIGQPHKTTGRFGTGFMTTHLLSEKVYVESFYKNDNGTFNKFSFGLDRGGKGEKEIIQGINDAFGEAERNIKKTEGITLSKDDFHTSFIYPLTQQKKSLANITIQEAKKGIAFTLINVPEISSVTVNEESGESTNYKIKLSDKISYQDQEFLVYNLLINGRSSKSHYLTVTGENAQIIIPASHKGNKYYATELETTIPRLHLDFPMIGTEDVNLPFVVNSSLFEPTEPRNGISLMGNEENNISKLNCGLILDAVDLYSQFLSYVGQDENWNDLYNLAKLKPPKKHEWIDPEWFRGKVIDPLRKELLHTPLVNVVDGNRISIWNENNEKLAYFPSAEKEVIRKQIWSLSQKIYPQFIPIQEHIDEWNKIIWRDCYTFSISELSKEIHNRENLANIADALSGTEKNAIEFLNDYYKLLNEEEHHITEILADKFNVIPNQLGEFKKKSELQVDKYIDEELKQACSLISDDPRSYLVHKYARTGEAIRYPAKEQNDIIAEINNIIKEDTNANISIVCDYLTSLFPEKNIPDIRVSIFDFCKRAYPDDFTQKRTLKYYDEKIWEESDKKSLYYVTSKVSDYKIVEEASKGFGFDTHEAFIHWLDSLVTFLVNKGFLNDINIDEIHILPNQNGIFCAKENLFLDNGDIDTKLKDISKELGHDFREELLDTSIFLELPENRTYSIEDVAEKISSFIKPILRDVDKRKEYKQTLKKFYVWMNENREKADAHFSDLFEKRFLFLEDDDISLNMKKATEFDQLMDEYGIKNIDDLRGYLSQLHNKDSNNEKDRDGEKIAITREILASLGISSPEEFEEAFKNPIISSRFYHTSTPTQEMYNYAQKLIERAKQNIREHLENDPDYDCTDIEETATTVLVGIMKNKVPIQIVTRPSDNGEVIIYYSSEKDTLDSTNSELWVDNGISTPHILTLGRILKSTGINKIPVNMD